MSKKRGFTLIELLAVIVILAVILVIAVPQIMNVITESRKGALASSAKLIASSAETAYISNQTLGIEKNIECRDISNYTDEDYASCSIKFVDGKAKVKIVGQGKFEGMAVCSGTKENAEVVDECPGPVSFTNDSWEIIVAAVKEGDTEKYNLGDTKTVDLGSLGTHTLRIANKSNDWEHCGEEGYSQTTCGFVIEFADVISEYNMNTTDTSVGGWPASAMYDYVNGDIYNALPEELRNAIILTKVVSGHGYRDENNFESDDYLYLLSPEEVYGESFTEIYDTSLRTSKQLDWYRDNGVTTSGYSIADKRNGGAQSYWWLRSVKSVNNNFYYVDHIARLSATLGTYTYGVSPAFRLG